MKKFFIILCILLLFAGVAFFAGWAQFGVPSGSVGVMRSKTHGLYPDLVREGEFRWIWYKLIPTNVTISAFRLDEQRGSVSIRGVLPSSQAYAAFAGADADFSYEFSASLSYFLDESSLVSLVEKHAIGGQDDLRVFEGNLSKDIGAFIQGRASDPSYFGDLEAVLEGGRSSALENDVRKEFPYVTDVSCLIQSVKFPDFALYRQLRGLYEEYLLQQREYLSAGIRQNAENRIESRLRFDELEKYGELLTRFPILIQYLSIERGLSAGNAGE
jgi:hypothetical protein